jgi:hypothetical protein
LPFFVSVPNSDLSLFNEHLQPYGVTVLSDEDIIKANDRIDPIAFRQLPGHISQQVVKSEFWRLGISDAYLCLDSDAVFIRNFTEDDYLSSDGTPYTVINEAQEFLTEALRQRKPNVIENFHRESLLVQNHFGRSGKIYSFGPMPMVWHRAVWESLELAYLRPQGMNFADAIQIAPLESRWYGEALLKFKAIALIPCEPFFKVYHYAWQLDHDRHRRVGLDQLAKLYSGVIYQSSWEREMDWPREEGSLFSWVARRLRRKLQRA